MASISLCPTTTAGAKQEDANAMALTRSTTGTRKWLSNQQRTDSDGDSGSVASISLCLTTTAGGKQEDVKGLAHTKGTTRITRKHHSNKTTLDHGSWSLKRHAAFRMPMQCTLMPSMVMPF